MLPLILMILIMTAIAWFMANVLSLLLIKTNQHLQSGPKLGLLWTAAWLPVILPLLTLLTLLIISLGKMWELIDDHCLSHALHHPHFCFFHLSPANFSWIHSVFLIMIAFAFVVIVSRLIQFNKQRLEAKQILNLSGTNQLLTRFENNELVAFTLGVFKPKIFVSDAIANQLSKREQRIIIAHEASHIRNKDALKNYLLDFLLVFHIKPANLKNDIRLMMEIKADQQMTDKFNRLEVAQLLIKLARFKFKHKLAMNFTGSQVENRISELLTPTIDFKHHLMLKVLAYGLFLMTPVLILTNHHAVETLAGWFF